MGANGMVYIGELDAYWRNLVEAYSKEKLDGAAVVCFPKVPMPAINHIADVNLDADRSLKLITRAEKYFAAKGLVSSCFRVSPSTRPTNFAQTLKKRGYSSEGKQSIMVYTQNVLPESINSKVSIGPVVKNNQIEEFNKLLLSIFQMPTGWLEAFSDFTKHSIRVGWQFFLAYSETKPLGVSALFSSGGVGGIYDVGTLEAFRGQGIGSILTLHTLRLSFDAGNRLHTLQAVNGGAAERLYQKLGFTVDHLVEFYSKQL